MKSSPRKTFPGWLSFVVGFALAVFFFYLLYRLTLPAKPFIYVSF
jgi:hypothetical protein